MNKLKSLVEISRRFQRSVNISADLTEPGQVLEGYELMQSGVNVINSLSDFYCNTEQRAFTITGAFGVGKSALGLFICSLFSNNQEIKNEALENLKDILNILLLRKAYCPAVLTWLCLLAAKDLSPKT